MSGDFWNGKRVFITGHTGFKGSWLCLWLKHLGAEVSGYALEPPTNPSLFELADVGGVLTDDRRGDVRDTQNLADALHHAAPDIVFHLAAQPLVRDSYERPAETFEVNAMGTVNLLDAVRESRTVKAVVVVTTDKCYENKEWHWAYRENEPLGGYDPYSASKACTELVTASYRNSFFKSAEAANIATARAGNVIGGGDYAKDRLIADIVRAMSTGEVVKIRNPGAVRPWQHVLEPLSGYLLLGQQLFSSQEYARAWNFGPAEADAKPVSWICDQMDVLSRNSAGWVHDDSEQVHEATFLKLDSSHARALLGWAPRLTLAEALRWIVEWNEVAREKGNLRTHTMAQIEQYMQSSMLD